MLEKFIDFLRFEKRFSERTVSIYTLAVRQFSEHAGVPDNDAQALSEISTQQIRTWVADLMQAGENTRTVNLKLAALQRFCQFLLSEKVLQKNPMQLVQRPKISKRLPVFFDESAIGNMLDDFQHSDSSGDYITVRDHTMVELLYTAGIRRAELLALRPCDVYLPEQIIRVTGKGDKQREVPLPAPFIRRLQHYLTLRQTTFAELSDKAPLFVNRRGRPLRPYVVNNVVHEQLSRQAGFAGKTTPHALRHSLATHLLNNGADILSIKETLGHANLSATQIYTHNSFKKLKNVYKKAHPRAAVK